MRTLVQGDAAGGGDDAHVGLDHAGRAERSEPPILKEPQQLGLQLDRHVADLVQEQRAAVGELDEAGLASLGGRVRPLLVTEELAFDQLARNRRAVDRDQGPRRPLAAWMAFANTSFPTPVSPTSRISALERARRRSLLVITAIDGDSVGIGASGRISSSLRAASSPGVTRRKTNTCEAMKIECAVLERGRPDDQPAVDVRPVRASQIFNRERITRL